MADEADIIEAAADPAPVVEETAPQPIEENPSPEVEAEEAPKTFTQEELDAAIAKRLAREERKWKRKLETPQAPAAVERPAVDPEDDVEAYAEARASQIADQRKQAESQAAILEAYQEREEEARDKYDDFEQVAYNPKLTVTPVMAETIQASDQGPDVIYWLGSNPNEAARISKLLPFQQAKEIGKIEAKLASDPPVRKTSSAPPPIVPVTPKANGTKVYDTTDPRSIASMSTSEWIEAERKRQTKQWEARRSA